jgi:hypothetical protein
MKRRLFVVGALLVGCLSFLVSPAHALSSDPKMYISADNTFYAYVKGGETISAAFTRVNIEEPFDTVRGDVTVTLEGPGVPVQTCILKKDVPVGQGCQFAAQTAATSGIWRVQFMVPAGARTYQEVSPVVRWGKNLFGWSITVGGSGGEQHGRIWTERYAIRQPAPAQYITDILNYYISEDGYIYKAITKGYNGQISTLSADSIGIRKGDSCVSVYQSTDVINTDDYSPALGVCGNAYKLFFEEPSGTLPTKATRWDGTTDWIRPNISRPSISELHYETNKSKDQLSGTISFFLRDFIGQYQIKVDVDNDGSFDGQNDVTLNEQMKKLSNGLQRIHFDGVDKFGRIIPPTGTIGIKVVITKVAEIHLVAADVEGRVGGLELVRLSGDNAPTTRLCWNDTDLAPLADSTLMTKNLDGQDCPESTGGLHDWVYNDHSWGNARYIDDWIYASAKLTGNNQITFPDVAEATQQKKASMMWVYVVAGVVGLLVLVAVVFVVLKKKGGKSRNLPPTPPSQPMGPNDVPPIGPGNNDRY